MKTTSLQKSSRLGMETSAILTIIETINYNRYAPKIGRVAEVLGVRIPGLGVFLLKSSTLDSQN